MLGSMQDRQKGIGGDEVGGKVRDRKTQPNVSELNRDLEDTHCKATLTLHVH